MENFFSYAMNKSASVNVIDMPAFAVSGKSPLALTDCTNASLASPDTLYMYSCYNSASAIPTAFLRL